MESRLKQESLHSYSGDFSSAIAESFFTDKEKITGEEILKLTNIQQINLFVLMYLFQAWEEESQKLKSPYFNYEHPDVKQALTRFQNSISNHIEITKNDFSPLLQTAVEKTLNLIFSPYHFYVEQFSHLENTDTSDLEKLLKYIRINPGLLKSLISRMESSRTYAAAELISLFDEVCTESAGNPEDFDTYLEKFSEIKDLKLDMVYAEEDEKDVEIKDTPEPEETTVAQPPVETGKKTMLNDKFSNEQKTLNDQIKAKLDSTLAEIHQNKKIDSLIKSISVNQRFQFTKELFSGNKQELEESIEKIDGMESLENAVSFADEIASRHKWNMETEEAVEFMLLIRRRFSKSDGPV